MNGEPNPQDYKSIIRDDKSLKIFLDCLRKFNTSFCDVMVEGCDFTLRLEVRGDKRKILHCQAYRAEISRP